MIELIKLNLIVFIGCLIEGIVPYCTVPVRYRAVIGFIDLILIDINLINWVFN